MQLVFDNLTELKDFIHEFMSSSPAPVVNHNNNQHNHQAAAVLPPPHVEAPPVSRRGRKPKALTETAVASLQPKAPRAYKKDGVSLTDRIRKVIDNFISNSQEFTANDVYYRIAKKDPEVNKQSVITSVLKQMNGMYVEIPFEERQGNGPRNVKVYIPA